MNKKSYISWSTCIASLVQAQLTFAEPTLSIEAELDMVFVTAIDQIDEGSFEGPAIELSLQAQVHPAVDLLTTITLEENGISLEEAQIGLALPKNFTLSFGREKLAFGTLNPLHDHDHLQVDTPHVFTELLAEEGLVGDGGHLRYTSPFLNQEISFTLGIYDRLQHDVGERIKNTPWLGRVQSSFQSSEKHTLVLGASYLAALGNGNTSKKISAEALNSARVVDLRYTWSPNGDKDQGLTLGGEYVHIDSQDIDIDNDTGLYVYAHWDFNHVWGLGYRYDSTDVLFSSLEEDAKIRAHSVYGQWRPKDFAQVKLQYQHVEDERKEGKDHILMVQSTFFLSWP